MLNIKKYRKQHNMTQLQLANALKVTQGAVNHWENGHAKPTLENLLAMAKLFGCTIENLMGK